jgi:hypothetical protein
MKLPTSLSLIFLSSAVLCGSAPVARAAEAQPKPAPAPAAGAAAPAVEEPAVDPQALAILKRAVDLLAGAEQFCVTAEIWEDVALENGTTIQTSKTAEIKLRRPDRLQVDVRTTQPKRSFFYDGKTLSVVDRQKNYYGSTPVPPTLDETLKKASETYGINFPLEDLLLSRPFGDGAALATAGDNLGPQMVLGTLCHHLSFRSENADWQVWIQDGPQAVIRKAVLVSNSGEDAASVTFLFNHWDLATKLPDFLFTFEPTASDTKVEILPEPAQPAAEPTAEPAK